MARTINKKPEPEKEKAPLPVEDMYTLQIVEVDYREQVEQLNGGQKDEVVLIAELTGTKNPDYEDEPYRVYIWGIREVKKLVAKFKGNTKASNGYNVLSAMGFDPDPNTKFHDVKWEALEGCYLRAFVSHTENGEYLRCKPSDIKALTDKELLAQNADRRDELFGDD